MQSGLLRTFVFNLRSTYNGSSIYHTQLRSVTALHEPPVIRIPVKMKEKIEEAGNKRKKWERRRIVERSQMGNKSVLIISCKRKDFNHYLGQSYSKFKEVPLASKGWHHRKSVGDYFIINCHGKSPAFSHGNGEPQSDFESLGLSKDLLAQITNIGFKEPTRIQAMAIPQVLEGKNTLITAETGNGKTLAFVAPMLQQIAERKNSFGHNLPFNTPLGLIIVPSRELAEQIYSVASLLGKEMGISVELVKGGRTKKLTLQAKMTQVELLVATMGALSKLTSAGLYDTSFIKHITIDEADSMLDDSFNDKLLHYMKKFPIQRSANDETTTPLPFSGIQLTLVSATMPRSLNSILSPIVDLSSVERISTPYLHRLMPHVHQQFIRVSNLSKSEKLLELAKDNLAKGIPFIVFSNYNKASDWVSLFLNENGIPCVNLNADMPAVLREGRFEKFQTGEVLSLSCTDLASRGLNTIRAEHIINFEFPKFISDYIHRCGRTGRVGSSATGLVTNLVFRHKEIELVQKIEYAARKTEEFHNVNANIKRILEGQAIKEGEEIM